ncbi:hypothetical protein A0H81_10054 [Grifola frondosa]|uniref:Uncharacterized protein n=1 Tax=Grifola frondosa TaxID=5627 RepID=A0A1C7LYA0_GRIFR|nr:hypothetical protein A0H81_10054 [Grifola frondosa]
MLLTLFVAVPEYLSPLQKSERYHACAVDSSPKICSDIIAMLSSGINQTHSGLLFIADILHDLSEAQESLNRVQIIPSEETFQDPIVVEFMLERMWSWLERMDSYAVEMQDAGEHLVQRLTRT